MAQFAFFIDLSRCIGCNSCVISCKQWHNILPGPIKLIRIHQWEKGFFPNLKLYILPIMCFHCERPICIEACPNGAIYKEKKYGAVLVDTNKCIGTKKCWQACPYGAPQFEENALGLKMIKCNMCIDRLEMGLKPICVLSCSMRALEFGVYDDLKNKYGDLRETVDMPKSTITKPAIVLKEPDLKKEIVPWDPGRALDLWRKRDSSYGYALPDIFTKKTEELEKYTQIISRNKLVLKSKNNNEFMYHTTDDE